MATVWSIVDTYTFLLFSQKFLTTFFFWKPQISPPSDSFVPPKKTSCSTLKYFLSLKKYNYRFNFVMAKARSTCSPKSATTTLGRPHWRLPPSPAMLIARLSPFLKHILHIPYFEDLILLILMVCFFLHITYRNIVDFSLL